MTDFGMLVLLTLLTGSLSGEGEHTAGEASMGDETHATGELHAVPTPSEGEVIRKVFRSPHGERAYRLYLPPTGPAESQGSEPDPPLVVLLHGCTQDAEDLARGTRMDELARDRGVAVLYPEQSSAAHPTLCWNWYEPEHQGRGQGEPALLAALIQEVVRDRALNPDQVFVAGISAGGAMAAILAATYPELVAAAASHSGVPFGAAQGLPQAMTVLEGTAEDPDWDMSATLRDAMGERARPVSFLVLHGDEDEIVSPRNADWFEAQWTGFVSRVTGTAPDRTSSPVEEGGERARSTWTIEETSGRIVFEVWRLSELGHAWSGGSSEGSFTDPNGPDASRILLDFFLEAGAS